MLTPRRVRWLMIAVRGGIFVGIIQLIQGGHWQELAVIAFVSAWMFAPIAKRWVEGLAR